MVATLIHAARRFVTEVSNALLLGVTIATRAGGRPDRGEREHVCERFVVAVDVYHVGGVLLSAGGDEQVSNGDVVAARGGQFAA
jgi:hypothetical protein